MKIENLQEIKDHQKSVKMVIFGQFGIGKTSLLKTLDEQTLCLDFEAGLLSVQDWAGDKISIKTWEEARDITCLICGANPSKLNQAYGKKHYDFALNKYNFTEKLKQYKCIFIDSITVASRLCLEYAKNQPDALNTKTGRPDVRSAYGTMAAEMLAWINQYQYLEGVDVIFVGGLDQKLDDFNRVIYAPQVEGSKVAAELPGILDEVITMTQFQGNRKFVCQTINQEGYPAKDRSGKLNVLEEAHLGKLLSKIKGTESIDDKNSSEETKSELKQIEQIMQNLSKGK